jgi:hypothetical protein
MSLAETAEVPETIGTEGVAAGWGIEGETEEEA